MDELHYNTHMMIDNHELAINYFRYSDADIDVDAFHRSSAPSPTLSAVDVGWDSFASLFEYEKSFLKAENGPHCIYSMELDSLDHILPVVVDPDVVLPLLQVTKHNPASSHHKGQIKYNKSEEAVSSLYTETTNTSDIVNIVKNSSGASNCDINTYKNSIASFDVATPCGIYDLEKSIFKPSCPSANEDTPCYGKLEESLMDIPLNDLPLLHPQQCALLSGEGTSSPIANDESDFEPYNIATPDWFYDIDFSGVGDSSPSGKSFSVSGGQSDGGHSGGCSPPFSAAVAYGGHSDGGSPPQFPAAVVYGDHSDGPFSAPVVDGGHFDGGALPQFPAALVVDGTDFYPPHPTTKARLLLAQSISNVKTQTFDSFFLSQNVKIETIYIKKEEADLPTLPCSSSASTSDEEKATFYTKKEEADLSASPCSSSASTSDEEKPTCFAKEETTSPDSTFSSSSSFVDAPIASTNYLDKFDFEKFFKQQDDEAILVKEYDAALALLELYHFSTRIPSRRNQRDFVQSSRVSKATPKRRLTL